LFLKVLNLSIWAGWIVLGVLILRFLLKKMPKWLHCLLWLMVAIRLVIPDSVESPVSVIPSKETVPQTIVTDSEPKIHSGLTTFNYYVNPILQENLAPEQGDDTDKTGQGNGKSETCIVFDLCTNNWR
jgi:beta-lactamase regulating signal transducer with metallopeptidase domain